ncbi:MAG: S8 family serine peptidase, partial [Acidobacteria bacterium]|nr:S8 family serine peptidase [Acidobacteriota bacterium]
MKGQKKRPRTAGIALLSLLLAVVCAGLGLTGDGAGGGVGVVRAQIRPGAINKVSPDLLDQLSKAQAGARVKVIIQPGGAVAPLALDTLLRNYGARIKNQLRNLNLRVIDLPADAVMKLAAQSEVRYVSLDRETKTFGHITTTSGADAVDSGLLSLGTLDGTGVGIAIIDSGIDTHHRSFMNAFGLSRVAVNQDFTGEGRTDDPYGHGTHVASAAAGNGQIASGNYQGIATNANIINLRVLNSQGTGSASALLSALDWVIANHTLFNIRVVNMSLGMTAVESYRNDPVCLAVRRLVNAGIVVLSASGNNGKDSAGNKIYGQIHSPGNEPSAITVGAANTFGTD